MQKMSKLRKSPEPTREEENSLTFSYDENSIEELRNLENK